MNVRAIGQCRDDDETRTQITRWILAGQREQIRQEIIVRRRDLAG